MDNEEMFVRNAVNLLKRSGYSLNRMPSSVKDLFDSRIYDGKGEELFIDRTQGLYTHATWEINNVTSFFQLLLWSLLVRHKENNTIKPILLVSVPAGYEISVLRGKKSNMLGHIGIRYDNFHFKTSLKNDTTKEFDTYFLIDIINRKDKKDKLFFTVSLKQGKKWHIIKINHDNENATFKYLYLDDDEFEKNQYGLRIVGETAPYKALVEEDIPPLNRTSKEYIEIFKRALKSIGIDKEIPELKSEIEALLDDVEENICFSIQNIVDDELLKLRDELDKLKWEREEQELEGGIKTIELNNQIKTLKARKAILEERQNAYSKTIGQITLKK